jgi:predicted molibdopterin-dependent oxidoreductase YjgC
MCDEGRYGFGAVDADSRLLAPTRREGSKTLDVSWEDAIGAAVDALRRFPPDAIGVLASPAMSNEDLFVLARLLDGLGIGQVAYRVAPRTPGYEDDFLIRADKNPNSAGAELLGLGRTDVAAMVTAARAGRIRCLWIFHHDLLDSALAPEAEVLEALLRVETLVFQGTNANATSRHAQLVLPAAAYAERDGTYTNFEGRVQRFRKALEPLGRALPDWDILARVAQAVGAGPRPSRAEECFRDLAAAVPAFAGMSYRRLGDGGRMIAGARR